MSIEFSPIMVAQSTRDGVRNLSVNPGPMKLAASRAVLVRPDISRATTHLAFRTFCRNHGEKCKKVVRFGAFWCMSQTKTAKGSEFRG